MNTDQTREQLIHIIENYLDSVILGKLKDGTAAEAAADVFLAENVVVPRADLPEVVEERGDLRVDGMVFANSSGMAERARRAALRYLAAAKYFDAKEAREAEAAKEAELTKRRDALANEVWKAGFGERRPLREYADLNPATQAAINWLMEAQDKLAKYEEAQA